MAAPPTAGRMDTNMALAGLKYRKPEVKPIHTNRDGKGKLTEPCGAEKLTVGEDELEPLSPAARLFHEPNFNVYIIAVLGSKTRIDPDILKVNLPHTLLRHPRFSSLQVLDERKHKESRWVPTEVDFNRHIIIPCIDENLDSPDKFVEDYIYNLTKTTIDKSQPLWDLHLLNVKITDAEAIVIFRIHHSLGDGTSLMSLLLACTRQVSNPKALPTIPVMKVQDQGDHVWIWRYFIALFHILLLLWNTMVDILMFVATALFLEDTPTPIKGPPGVESTPRRIVWRTVCLGDMKLVKNAMNATINDVALGITQAGISKYLNRIYGKKQNEVGVMEKKDNLPKNIRLRSTLLINVRASAGIQELADMMEKNTKAKWGNWIGYVLLPLTIAIRNDPLDYIREAKARVDRKKRSFEAMYTFSIAEIILKLFGIKKASALSHRIITHTTLCFSNMVGPLEEIGFYGHSMEFLAPSSFNQPHGLMINFQSYVNKMTIVLSVDESTIPDPHKLLDDITESLDLIKDALLFKKSAQN